MTVQHCVWAHWVRFRRTNRHGMDVDGPLFSRILCSSEQQRSHPLYQRIFRADLQYVPTHLFYWLRQSCNNILCIFRLSIFVTKGTYRCSSAWTPYSYSWILCRLYRPILRLLDVVLGRSSRGNHPRGPWFRVQIRESRPCSPSCSNARPAGFQHWVDVHYRVEDFIWKGCHGVQQSEL